MSLLLYLLYLSVILTDDERISDCCCGFGVDVIMTS